MEASRRTFASSSRSSNRRSSNVADADDAGQLAVTETYGSSVHLSRPPGNAVRVCRDAEAKTSRRRDFLFHTGPAGDIRSTPMTSGRQDEHWSRVVKSGFGHSRHSALSAICPVIGLVEGSPRPVARLTISGTRVEPGKSLETSARW
jgi:hypothetical protein